MLNMREKLCTTEAQRAQRKFLFFSKQISLCPPCLRGEIKITREAELDWVPPDLDYATHFFAALNFQRYWCARKSGTPSAE